MEAKRRFLELLLTTDASWRVRRVVVEEHGHEEVDEGDVELARALHRLSGITRRRGAPAVAQDVRSNR